MDFPSSTYKITWKFADRFVVKYGPIPVPLTRYTLLIYPFLGLGAQDSAASINTWHEAKAEHAHSTSSRDNDQFRTDAVDILTARQMLSNTLNMLQLFYQKVRPKKYNRKTRNRPKYIWQFDIIKVASQIQGEEGRELVFKEIILGEADSHLEKDKCGFVPHALCHTFGKCKWIRNPNMIMKPYKR